MFILKYYLLKLINKIFIDEKTWSIIGIDFKSEIWVNICIILY